MEIANGHGILDERAVGEQVGQSGTATSPNQTEPSGAAVMELGLLWGDGRA